MGMRSTDAYIFLIGTKKHLAIQINDDDKLRSVWFRPHLFWNRWENCWVCTPLSIHAYLRTSH